MYLCAQCGSKSISERQWRDVNTGKFSESCEDGYAWCESCNSEVKLDEKEDTRKLPTIRFSFHGYIEGAEIETAQDGENGTDVDVSGMSAAELVDKLNTGKLMISLGDYLYDSRDAEINIEDFEQEDS